MVDLTPLKTANQRRWSQCQIIGMYLPILDVVAKRLVDAKPRYTSVTNITGVPWPVIAVIHEREASQSWSSNLANGDSWGKCTIHVPKGRGPFKSWEEAADDALLHCPPRAGHWDDWSIAGALTLLECYNGLGYYRMHMPSPYVWASTNQYIKGKYTADGHFDPNAIDHQLGCAALLMQMTSIDKTIANEWQE